MQVARRPVGMGSCSSARLRETGRTDELELVPTGLSSVDESVIGQLKALEIDTKLARKLTDHIHRLLHRRRIVGLTGLPSLLGTKFRDALEQLIDILFVLAG